MLVIYLLPALVVVLSTGLFLISVAYGFAIGKSVLLFLRKRLASRFAGVNRLLTDFGSKLSPGFSRRRRGETMMSRKLLCKEPLTCGCLRYTYQSCPGILPHEHELVACAKHRELATVPSGNFSVASEIYERLMSGVAPKERDYIPVRYFDSSFTVPVRYNSPRYHPDTVKVVKMLTTGVFMMILFLSLCCWVATEREVDSAPVPSPKTGWKTPRDVSPAVSEMLTPFSR